MRKRTIALCLLPALLIALILSGCAPTRGQERRLAFLGKPLRAEVRITRGGKVTGGILELGEVSADGDRFMRLTFTCPESLAGVVAEKSGDDLTVSLGGRLFDAPEAAAGFLRAGELFSDTGVLLSAKRIRQGEENLTELTMSSSAGDRVLTLNDSDRLLCIETKDVKTEIVWIEKPSTSMQ